MKRNLLNGTFENDIVQAKNLDDSIPGPIKGEVSMESSSSSSVYFRLPSATVAAHSSKTKSHRRGVWRYIFRE